MQSTLGEKTYFNKSKENPYVTYSYGVKLEGQPPDAFFTTKESAWNAFYETFINEVIKHQDKQLVWRSFPTEHEGFIPSVPDITIYYVTARFCFE